MADTSALAPLQLIQLRPDHFQTEEGVAEFNQYLSILTQRVNAIGPSTGSAAEFPNGIDLSGAPARNVGGVGPEHSAISLAVAEQRYGAKAIAPQLEAGQPNSLKSVRRLNDPTQRENHSVWLEGVLNTAPTTNNSTISGSGATVTVSSGFHLLVSGNVQSYASRTDTVSLPSSFAIATLSRTSGVVTCTTTAPTGYTPGSVININEPTDPTFDGSFVLATAVGVTLTWRQVAPDATVLAPTGHVSESGVYYYRLRTNTKTLTLTGPFSTDSQQNRLEANVDGGVLIAVAVFTGSGLDLTQSCAGATPPPANSGIHLLTRL